MSGLYAGFIRIGPALLLIIALIDLLGSLPLALMAGRQQGFVFGLSAALSSTMVPFIAASILLRFDRWFAARTMDEVA